MFYESSHIKGQEYFKLSDIDDYKGNKINTQRNDDNTAGTTSTGRGGVLDSVAQNYIEDLDVEKDIDILEFISMEQNLLEAVNFFNEFQEDENGNPVNPDEENEDEEYNVNDDDQENNQDQNDEPQNNEQPQDDDTEDEEYSIDDEDDHPDTQSDNQNNQEVDDQQSDQNQDDNSDDEDYEIPDDDGDDNQQDNQQTQDGNNNNPDGAPEPDEDDEFSMDDNTPSSSGENDNSDVGGNDLGYSSSDDSSSGEDNTSEKLKDLETVIFDDLSSEEKKMKIKELKELYITVYNKCSTILDLITDIKKDEETIQIIEYISNTLLDLKQYVNDYMNDVFDSKTYMENLSQLQKYLMIFNAINKVFAQIRSENN